MKPEHEQYEKLRILLQHEVVEEQKEKLRQQIRELEEKYPYIKDDTEQ
jgi:hypothetical protein